MSLVPSAPAEGLAAWLARLAQLLAQPAAAAEPGGAPRPMPAGQGRPSNSAYPVSTAAIMPEDATTLAQAAAGPGGAQATARFSFARSAALGPGFDATLQRGSDLLEVGLHLQDVGGRTARPVGAGRTAFEVPRDGSGGVAASPPPTAATPGSTTTAGPTATTSGPTAAPATASPTMTGSGTFSAPALALQPLASATPTPTGGPARAALADTPTATATAPATVPAATAVAAMATSGRSGATTATAPPTATRAPAATGSALATPTGAAPTATPTPSGTPPTATATALGSPSALAPGGNRYGARIDVTYEVSPDSTRLKDTLRLHDRPTTNVLAYRFEPKGLSPRLEADGSISLADGAGRPTFKILAPSLEDAAGTAGNASYRLQPGQLEVVLDPDLVSRGQLPLTLDPTLVLVTDSGLLDAAPAPYQRQAVAAADGNQAFLFYDTSAGQRGVRLVTSEDHWASLRGPSTMVADLGSGDFAAEIFKDDTIYLALPGRDNNLNRLRVYPLRYDTAARTWNPQPPIDVRASSDLAWAGVSVAIERGDGGGSGNYLWVAADERDGNGRWTAKTWHTSVSGSGTLGSTWAEATPNFTPTTDYRHHGALVAISGGVTVVGRDGTSQRSNSYKRVGGWQGLQTLSDGYARGGGREFSLLAAVDPRSPGGATTVPIALFGRTPPGGGADEAARLYFQRYDGPTWANEPTAAVAADERPGLTWDGAALYAFRLRKLGPRPGRWPASGRR